MNTMRRIWAPAYVPWSCMAFMVWVLVWVQVRITHTPAPQAAGSQPRLFSEGRARVHLDYLAGTIGDRQVSMPGLQLATDYMVKQLEGLKALGKDRHDVNVEVVQQSVSGAIGMTFTSINFTNAYRSLDTLALVLTPRGTEHLKAVLMASHYDSAVCSTGAADDGMQAAVMLEAARTILSGPRLPHTPLVFLWTGGEEPISQAASGWRTQSLLYQRLGAFINLEAMGGGGVPIVFQHTGSWVLEAWARGCPLPRGSRVAQDVFDLHIIPADSDFRMFSARHYGSLPGLDIAFLLDSTAYHSYLDTPERVKPGIMQEMGESLLGGMFEISRDLAARQARGPVPTAMELKEAQQRSVYFDVLGYRMVVYSDQLADKLHIIPAIILLTLPLLTYPPSRPVIAMMTRRAYFEMCMGAVRALASLVLGVAVPAALGAARTLLTGKPMIWFAQHWVGDIQFMPIAIAGALLPFMGLRNAMEKAAPLSQGGWMAAQIQGSALTASLVALLLTYLGMRGNAMIFALDGALGIVASLIVNTPTLGVVPLLALCLASLVPMAIGGSAVAVFLGVMMERMALAGHVHPVLADVIVGVLSGAGVLAITCGVFLPLLGATIRGNRRMLLAGLVACSVAAAAWTAHTQPAYLPHAPKRTVITHLIQTTMASKAGTAPAAGGVAMKVVGEAVSISGVDSMPLTWAINMSRFQLVPPVGRELQPLHPLDALLHGIVVAPPDPATTPLIDRVQRYCHGLSAGAHLPTGPAAFIQSVISNLKDMAAGSGDGGSVQAGVQGRSGGGGERGGKAEVHTRVPAAVAGGACSVSLKGLAEPELPDTPLVSHLPYIQLESIEHLPEQPEGGAGAVASRHGRPAAGAGQQRPRRRVRVHLALFSELPCWGILNVTAPGLTAWSFTKQLTPSHICETCGDAQHHVIRFTSQDPDPLWRFSLDIALPETTTDHPNLSAFSGHEQLSTPTGSLWLTTPDPASDTESGDGLGLGGGSAAEGIKEGIKGKVRVELSVSYLQRTHTLRRVLALLPDTTAETWLATAYQSFWEL